MEADLFDQIRQFATTRRLRAVLAMLLLLTAAGWLVQPALAAKSALATNAVQTPLAVVDSGDASHLLEPDGDAISEGDTADEADHVSTCSADDLSDTFAHKLEYGFLIIASSPLHDDQRHAVLRVASETFRPPIA